MKTFTAACREYFGMLPGQVLTAFGAELKTLTPQDKMDIRGGFLRMGIECEIPAGCEGLTATPGY